jgi:ATP-dependent DNA ligase
VATKGKPVVRYRLSEIEAWAERRTVRSRIPCFEEEGRALFEAAGRLDLEGIVAKRKADPYVLETRWYKIKNPRYTQAEGGRISVLKAPRR